MKTPTKRATRRLAASLAIVVALASTPRVWSAESDVPAEAWALIPAPRELVKGEGTCKSAAKPKVERVAGIPAEGYELSVKSDGVTIRASDDAGEFYARQTLE
jgi:N-acetyl-beta-hexosaminidase